MTSAGEASPIRANGQAREILVQLTIRTATYRSKEGRRGAADASRGKDNPDCEAVLIGSIGGECSASPAFSYGREEPILMNLGDEALIQKCVLCRFLMGIAPMSVATRLTSRRWIGPCGDEARTCLSFGP